MNETQTPGAATTSTSEPWPHHTDLVNERLVSLYFVTALATSAKASLQLACHWTSVSSTSKKT